VEACRSWRVGGAWRQEEKLFLLVEFQRMKRASRGADLPSTRVNKAQVCAKLEICLPVSSPSLAGRGGEGKRGVDADPYPQAWRQGGVTMLRRRKLPSDGKVRRRYLWPRGPLRASGVPAQRFLLPPNTEDLGLQRGTSTPAPDQVVSSPIWIRWPLPRGQPWRRWRRTGSRFIFLFKVLLAKNKDYVVILVSFFVPCCNFIPPL
jgi:hypothetical protein